MKVGDVVSLKSGSPSMTVTTVDGELVVCAIWCGPEFGFKFENFPAAAVQKTQSHDG